MTEPRIPTATLRTLGPLNWIVTTIASKAIRADDMHLFSTLGQTRGLFRGWLHYSARLMPFGSLPRKDTEVVILRVAATRECAYELDHHLRLGERAGLDVTTIAAVTAGPDDVEPTAAPLTDRIRTIIAAVDELLGTRDLSDATWASLAALWTDRQRIEFVLLVTQYDGLATTIGTLRIPRDH